MLKSVLIGSRAVAIRRPECLSRPPRDIDIITDSTTAAGLDGDVHASKFGLKCVVMGDPVIEAEIAEPGSTGDEFMALVRDDPQTVEVSGFMVPSLDALFALKTSHRFAKNSPHFWKNLHDWHAMRAAGASITDRWKSWLRRRAKATYDFKPPTLTGATKSSFFTDNVEYVYDHDAIHRIIALGDGPAYRRYMVDNAEVQCDPLKFRALPLSTRIAGVVEEACVLAIERSLVPFDGVDPHRAWLYAFGKVATSITSGWFRRFAYEHALDVIAAYPEDYWKRFQAAVKRGEVPRHRAD